VSWTDNTLLEFPCKKSLVAPASPAEDQKKTSKKQSSIYVEKSPVTNQEITIKESNSWLVQSR
jgi:hypothetical protein